MKRISGTVLYSLLPVSQRPVPMNFGTTIPVRIIELLSIRPVQSECKRGLSAPSTTPFLMSACPASPLASRISTHDEPRQIFASPQRPPTIPCSAYKDGTQLLKFRSSVHLAYALILFMLSPYLVALSLACSYLCSYL